jgi:SAM-dependent methyltransferase
MMAGVARPSSVRYPLPGWLLDERASAGRENLDAEHVERYSRYALHHLPDAWKAVALTRMREVLRPGGVLRLWDIVYDFDPEEAAERLEAWCATGGKDIVGDWSRAELEEHVREEYSTYAWLLEPMFERAHFVIEDASHSADGIFARYVLRAS